MTIYHRTFRIRSYECDAYGHLNNVSYVRFLHEATLDALAEAGQGIFASDPAGQRLPVLRTRRLDIEYLRPVRFGESLAVKVTPTTADASCLRWTADFRVAGSDDLVAQARSESCFVDAGTGRPLPMPSPLASALRPAPGGEPAGPVEPMPALPPAPRGAFAVRRRVAWSDLDLTRRVADATLLSYAEACGMEVIAAHGWPAQRMVAEGFAIILRRHQIEFGEPAALEDELEVATWVSDVRRASATRHYVITRLRDGALLARIDTLGVWIELATGRPIRIPPQLLADFAANIVS